MTADRTSNVEIECEEEAYKDKNLLRELYLQQDLTIPEVADELGCSTWTVKKYLTKYNSRRKQIHNLLLTEKRLQKLYVEKRLSPREIAERLRAVSSTRESRT